MAHRPERELPEQHHADPTAAAAARLPLRTSFLTDAFTNAISANDPLANLPSLRCFIAGGGDGGDDDPARQHQLLNLARDGELERMRNGILRHLARLRDSVASFPNEVVDAAENEACAARVVDGICALALYTSNFPLGDRKFFAMVNAALRITGGSGETMFSRGDAEFVLRSVEPFTRATTWMLRDVLPRRHSVTFRGTGFELERPRIGARFEQHCFNSMSEEHRAAGRFARRTMMVLMTQSGASITFASFFQEDEILLPPGVVLEVVAVASATLLNVLHFEPGKKLVTLREVGMRPTANELFKAVRAVLPVYADFIAIYQMPSLAPRGAVGGGAVGGVVGGEAGGGAAAGNDNNNANAVRLDAALDQNIINSSNDSDMLIIADGGTGKTAAAVFAQVHLSRQDASRRLLPVFLPLSRLKQDDVTRQGGLDAALATALGCDVATLLQTAREFSVVAILDSLDETTVKDEHWAGLLERNPAAQQCRVVMTSRPLPLATQQYQHILGSARRVQVLDLLPLPQQDLNRIFAHLVEDDNVQLPAALLASGDATPLLASFAATLVNNNNVDISGITGQRELLELYLQHTCDLPQQALSQLCFQIIAGGFHCTLGEAKLAAGRVADIASRVPCRVEDEFDDGADFSLLHRSLVEHVVARDVAAGRLSFRVNSPLQKLSPVLLGSVVRMVLADTQCPFSVRLDTLQQMIHVQRDGAALEIAQEMLAEEERRAGSDEPTEALVRLLDLVGNVHRQQGRYALAEQMTERSVEIRQRLHEQDPNDRARALSFAASLNNIAIIKRRRRDFDAARAAYERALELKEQHGAGDVDKAQTYENFAGFLLSQNTPGGEQHNDNARRALQIYERCLATYEARLGRGHHQVAMCLHNLAGVWLKLPFDENDNSDNNNNNNTTQNAARALDLLTRAVDINRTALDSNHINNAFLHLRLGEALRALRDRRRHDEANQAFATAQRLWELHGRTDQHRVCARALDNLTPPESHFHLHAKNIRFLEHHTVILLDLLDGNLATGREGEDEEQHDAIADAEEFTRRFTEAAEAFPARFPAAAVRFAYTGPAVTQRGDPTACSSGHPLERRTEVGSSLAAIGVEKVMCDVCCLEIAPGEVRYECRVEGCDEDLCSGCFGTPPLRADEKLWRLLRKKIWFGADRQDDENSQQNQQEEQNQQQQRREKYSIYKFSLTTGKGVRMQPASLDAEELHNFASNDDAVW